MYHLPEVCPLVDLDYDTLYKYVRAKRILQPKRSLTGHYYYSQSDIARLQEQIKAIKMINRNFFKKFNEKRIRREAK